MRRFALYHPCFPLLLFSLITACSPKTNTAIQAEKDGYQLIWADEFNNDGRPDSKNWVYEQGFVRNDELQWYQPDNALVKDGFLIIEARRERKANSNYNPQSTTWRENREYADYTSASLTTEGLHDWQYGRFEMRAKIDTRSGMWPAYWTLGVDKEWPSNGEIDIMEFYRGILLANFAWGTDQRWTPKWDSVRKPIKEWGADWPNEFHIWRMDWNEKQMQLFVDDTLLNEVNLEETYNGDGSGFNPFRQPHYLLLSLAIGGANGGDPAQTDFPARFEIDYVRVYQQK